MRLLPSIVALLLAAPPASASRRLLLALGENRGVAGDVDLQLADDDARAFAEVMIDVGAVRPQDARVLDGGDAVALARALEAVDAEVRAAAPDVELFVYVSAHGADGDLHLRGTRFPITTLRAFVRDTPARIGVLVVDSCQAGWGTRTKGSADEDVVKIEEPEVAGRVFIASSGATEVAHESPRMGGSYFTRHLIAAIRGAATVNDDRVTLQEAFSYTARHTAESAFAAGAPQRPVQEIFIRGQGDLVLSVPSRGQGQIALLVERPGLWQLVPSWDGPPLHVHKPAGVATLAVPPGRWQALVEEGGVILAAEVEVSRGEVATVDAGQLRPVASDATQLKGSGAAFGAGARVASGAVPMRWPVVGAALFARGRTSWADWVETEVGFGRGDTTQRITQWEADVAIGGGAELDWGAVVLRPGARLGGVLVHQVGAPGRDRTGVQPRAGLSLGVGGASAVAWEARLAGGVQRVGMAEGMALTPYGAAMLAFTVVP